MIHVSPTGCHARNIAPGGSDWSDRIVDDKIERTPMFDFPHTTALVPFSLYKRRNNKKLATELINRTKFIDVISFLYAEMGVEKG